MKRANKPKADRQTSDSLGAVSIDKERRRHYGLLGHAAQQNLGQTCRALLLESAARQRRVAPGCRRDNM
eukprot:11215839-Lingulodinium_polyedra.AAC.1